jgi:hypothetical protein
MAMIVRIYINEHCILVRSCVRKKGKPGQMCEYETDDGRRIRHHYNDGAEELARKLLRTTDRPRVAAQPSD